VRCLLIPLEEPKVGHRKREFAIVGISKRHAGPSGLYAEARWLGRS
jgi:hypothetical protein